MGDIVGDCCQGNQDLPNDLSQDVASAIQLVHPSIKANAEQQTGGGGPDPICTVSKTTVLRPPAL